jgi:hypothetical protein
MNKLTIQINNLEALERLIGGQSDVEIEIRNSVVQKFAEKHLKPLANCPEITSTLSAIKDNIAKQVKEKCEKDIATFQTSWGGSITDVKLNPNINAEIERRVRVLTDEAIRKAVDESVHVNDEEIKKRIENRFEYYTTDFINREVKAKIDRLKASL